MKLLIRNLARNLTEAEIRPMFEAYGLVQSCTIVMDKNTGQSKGFGFVEMPKAGEAKVAVKNLNGKEVAESKIRVKKAEPKSEKTVENEVKTTPEIENSKAGFQGYGKKNLKDK